MCKKLSSYQSCNQSKDYVQILKAKEMSRKMEESSVWISQTLKAALSGEGFFEEDKSL